MHNVMCLYTKVCCVQSGFHAQYAYLSVAEEVSNFKGASTGVKSPIQLESLNAILVCVCVCVCLCVCVVYLVFESVWVYCGGQVKSVCVDFLSTTEGIVQQS